MRKAAFPKVIREGHSRATIYQTPYRGSMGYTVVWYEGETRKRKLFADLGEAELHAQARVGQLAKGTAEILRLDGGQLLEYVRAKAAVEEFGLALDTIAIEYRDARHLGNGASPVEMARFYAKHNPTRMPKKLVPEVVTEMIAAKEADRMSAVYLKDLRGRLGRFAKSFQGQISLVTSAEIEDFLRGLNLTGRSRNNYRRAIATMFYFAESRGYLPKGFAQVDSVALAKQEATEIEIFRPEEMARLMAYAEAALVPFIAIGGFAGLRHAEIQRLDWAEVRLDDGFIEVKASKAKTASRRLVPITENLKAWLAPLRKPTGPVCEYANVTKQLLWLSEAVNEGWQKENPPGAFTWKHNALRHSFISYRVAGIQNVAQVALEAGNSPRMVFSNYRELVRPADAEKWFGITPASVAEIRDRAEREKAARIVAFPATAAA